MVFKAVLSFLLLGLSLIASADEVNLTCEDQKVVLERLNDICGDTWCEGDYVIDFASIDIATHQNRRNFVLTFIMSDRDLEHNNQKTVSCELEKSNLLIDFISNLKFGNRPESDSSLFQVIDRCISKNSF